ncbi:MAG: hypothetical protein ACFFFK_10450 [Candidatus Thorarchaeota archaeon]
MEIAEIQGIDEEDLFGYIRALPNFWEQTKRIFEPGIELILQKIGDTEDILLGVFIFSHYRGQIVIFMEYQRDIRTAIFEIHGYQINQWGTFVESKSSENRLRRIIENSADGDFKAFSAIPEGGIFVCPNCRAQYSLRVLKITKDGKIECQNCGKFVEYPVD